MKSAKADLIAFQEGEDWGRPEGVAERGKEFVGDISLFCCNIVLKYSKYYQTTFKTITCSFCVNIFIIIINTMW